MFARLRLQRLLTSFSELFNSSRVFWWAFGTFLCASVWMALSGVYSMAFDEYVHFGTIHLYAHQWSPFFGAQPVGADPLGAVARDPSYLYHYLMSFPYRLFAHFVHAFTAQVIFLRLCDIVFFAGGLLLFRAALRRAGMGQRTTNIALGFLMVLPVTPFMAAQVNYDDLLFLLTGLSVWLAAGVAAQLRGQGRLALLPTLWLAVTALLASLVKYAYLPILVGLVVYLVAIGTRRLGWSARRWWLAAKPSIRTASRWQLILAGLVLLLSVALFTERYGVNLVAYGSPTPECNQVLSLQHCMAYEPFARNYQYHQTVPALPLYRILLFPFADWIGGMVRSLLFVVGSKQIGYPPGEPLLLTYIAGWTVFAGGLGLLILRGRWLWHRSTANQLFLVISATYTGVLFLQNFADYLHTRVPVAIQGRYLVPILPLFLVLVVQAAGGWLRRLHRLAPAALLALLCVLMIEGGSLVPWIVRSDDRWLWNAPAVRQVNHAAKDVLDPIMWKITG